MSLSQILALLLALATPVAFAAAHGSTPTAQDGRSNRKGEIWVLPHPDMSPAEQALALTLQGLVNRTRPRLWMQAGGMSAVVLDELRREGWRVRNEPNVWNALHRFRPSVKGMIVYKAGTPSLNVATSLCGPMSAVAVEESLVERALEAGLKVRADVRGWDDRQAFGRYGKLFTKGAVVEQALDKPGHLRDFAVAHNTFVFATAVPAFRTEVARTLGPEATVYGWFPPGGDERDWIRDLSRANATGVAADWSLNLSALEKLPAGRLSRPRRRFPAAEEDVRYVAFVMSDGDNIQWMAGGFVHDKGFWASPLRGTFPMTWEVAPVLASVAPRALRHLYRTATPNDAFITGPGLPGYTYPHFQPDRAALARRSAPVLRASDLSVVSVLNDNAGSPAQTLSLLELPGVDGIVYKDYAPYHRRKGEILWHKGKPCVAYKFLLWEGVQSIEEMAKGVAEMPASSRTDPGSYALVNVHAWSYKSIGGPMEAVRRAIAQLPPNTRVVTADHLLHLLKQNFGRP